MYETYTTVVGRLATTPEQATLNDGQQRVRFRLANATRWQDRSTGSWVDGPDMFLSVVCWRKLAENAFASLEKGDPVVVYGRLRAHTYDDKDGKRITLFEIDAITVGPDLGRCTAAPRWTRSATSVGASSGGRSPQAVVQDDGTAHTLDDDVDIDRSRSALSTNGVESAPMTGRDDGAVTAPAEEDAADGAVVGR